MTYKEKLSQKIQDMKEIALLEEDYSLLSILCSLEAAIGGNSIDRLSDYTVAFSLEQLKLIKQGK